MNKTQISCFIISFAIYSTHVFSIEDFIIEDKNDSVYFENYKAKFDEAMKYVENNIEEYDNYEIESNDVNDILDEAFKNNSNYSKTEGEDITKKILDNVKDIAMEQPKKIIEEQKDKAKEQMYKWIEEKIQSFFKTKSGNNSNTQSSSSEKNVWDLPQQEMFLALQKKHENDFQDWLKTETTIATNEIANKSNMIKIESYQSDMINSLKSVDGILKLIGSLTTEAFKYAEIVKLVKQIASIHDQLYDEIHIKPFTDFTVTYSYQLIGYETMNAMKNLKKRSEKIKRYVTDITTVWTEGMSLQNNADRIKQIDNIEKELQAIRSISYVLLHKMKTIKQGEVLHNIRYYTIKTNNSEIAQDVLRNSKNILQ